MSIHDANTTSVVPLPLDPSLPMEDPSEPSSHTLPSQTLPDWLHARIQTCLLYTSDAADERSSVDLGGRRIIKKKNRINILSTQSC